LATLNAAGPTYSLCRSEAWRADAPLAPCSLPVAPIPSSLSPALPEVAVWSLFSSPISGLLRSVATELAGRAPGGSQPLYRTESGQRRAGQFLRFRHEHHEWMGHKEHDHQVEHRGHAECEGEALDVPHRQYIQH